MWIYEGREFLDDETEDYVAFVYQIENLETGKKYIGKKNLTKVRSKKIKGKTRRKRIKSESDWREYYGSSKTLLEDVARLGKDKFKREIVKLCKSRGTANYWEAYEIMTRNAIISNDYYNESLHVRVHCSHVKF